MQNVGIETQVVWKFDRPIKITYEYFDGTKSFSVTGAEYRVSTHREPYVWLRGFELLKSGKPRKNKVEGIIFPDKTYAVLMNDEWVYIDTPVVALMDQCKRDGQAYLDKHYATV
jgi:hypothetical protein